MMTVSCEVRVWGSPSYAMWLRRAKGEKTTKVHMKPLGHDVLMVSEVTWAYTCHSTALSA